MDPPSPANSSVTPLVNSSLAPVLPIHQRQKSCPMPRVGLLEKAVVGAWTLWTCLSLAPYDWAALELVLAALAVLLASARGRGPWATRPPSRRGDGAMLGAMCAPLVLAASVLRAQAQPEPDRALVHYLATLSFAACGCALRVALSLHGLHGSAAAAAAVAGLAAVSTTPMSLLFAVLGVFELLLSRALVPLHRTMTAGEATLLGTGIALATVDAALLTAPWPLDWLPVRSTGAKALSGGLVGILFVGVFMAGALAKQPATATNEFDDSDAPTPRKGLTALFFPLLALVVPWCTWLLGHEPISWVLGFLTEDPRRWLIALYWTATLALFLRYVADVCTRFGFSGIVSRKLFHALAVALFAPGTLELPDMMGLSYGVAIGALLLVEYVRFHRVPPAARPVHEFMTRFVDCKDDGGVILSHTYLLGGCAAPLWLEAATAGGAAPLLTRSVGVLALGLGDSAGAIVGSRWGRLCWKGSRKTLEGTLASLVVVLGFGWGMLQLSGELYTLSGLQVAKLGLAALISCLLEAFTLQIDNLFFPLCAYSTVVLALSG